MKNVSKLFALTFVLAGMLAQPALAKDGDIEICGIIETISDSVVVIAGVSYPLNSNTEYEDENDLPLSNSDFSSGELIELTIRDGAVHEIEKEDEANCSGSDDDEKNEDSSDDEDSKEEEDSKEDEKSSDDDQKKQEFCGKITAITATSVTVGSKEFPITPNTEFESRSGTKLTFDAFVVGDYVEVEIKNGELHELELDSSSSCKSSKATDSSSKKNNSSFSASQTLRKLRLRSKLTPASDVQTSANGQVKYQSRAKKGKARDRLQVKVKIPLPSTVPTLASEQDASGLNLNAYIQRGGSTIAICNFEFDEVENNNAEYKIDIREKEGRLRVKKGSCDIDLAQAGDQIAVPSLARGDEVFVILPDLSELLAGVL